MKHIHLFLSFLLIFSINLLIAQAPTFGNTGAITICVNGSYYLNPSTTNGIFSSNDPLIATVNASGYVTGVSEGYTTVQLVTNGGSETVSATIHVGSSSGLSITDPLAQASYKFNNNPQGPIGGLNNYVGYNGYSYSSQTRPINTGFYRASIQSGNDAGCPYEYYIFRCTTCGIVPEYTTRPQGTLTGNTIQSGLTGQLTYTSSNGGGPFTIVYLPAGGSNVTVNNISSTVAFNVVTPTITTSYKLISVTDESTNASTDFSGANASITVIPHYVGESFQGGKIFYVDGTGQHGLIAATSDEVSTLNWVDAINACNNKIIDVYSDWYLPSRDELNKLYINRVAIGGFASVYYWSSTESTDSTAWDQPFYGGPQESYNKNYMDYVRAIRAF